MGCKVTDNQYSLYLTKTTEISRRDQTSHPWFKVYVLSRVPALGTSVLVQEFWAELVRSVVIGQEQSVWCTGGLTSYRGKDIDMSLTILFSSTNPIPLPPFSAYVLNQRAVWPSDRGTLAENPAWVKWCHSGLVNMVGRERERERELGQLVWLLYTVLSCSLDMMIIGSGRGCQKSFTQHQHSTLTSIMARKRCLHYTTKSSCTHHLPYQN